MLAKLSRQRELRRVFSGEEINIMELMALANTMVALANIMAMFAIATLAIHLKQLENAPDANPDAIKSSGQKTDRKTELLEKLKNLRLFTLMLIPTIVLDFVLGALFFMRPNRTSTEIINGGVLLLMGLFMLVFCINVLSFVKKKNRSN